MSASPSPKRGAPGSGPTDDSLQDLHAQLVKKKPEAKEGYSLLPLVLLGFVSSMIFVVAIYFVHHRADFDSLAFDERYEKKAGGTVAVVAVDPVVLGKKLYSTPGACVTCHQPTGAGLPPAFPPLANSPWVKGSEERVIRILLHGLKGELKIDGVTYNGNMPAFGPGGGFNWSDEKIAAVLTYVRQDWGNSASVITAEKVKEIRTVGAASRKSEWTEAELLAIP